MSDDLIKREDVIEAIHDYWKGELGKMPVADSEYGEVLVGDCTELLKHNKELSTRIKAIPSAERPQGWISCSERLPEWNTRVLFYLEKKCYYDYPEPQYVTDWWIQEGSFNDKYGVFIYDSPDIGKGIPKDYVVAWMPLPEPWKGANDE